MEFFKKERKMTEKRAVAEVFFTDPLTGQKIKVQSVYYPTRTLLQGKEYTRANGQLGQRQGVLK